MRVWYHLSRGFAGLERFSLGMEHKNGSVGAQVSPPSLPLPPPLTAQIVLSMCRTSLPHPPPRASRPSTIHLPLTHPPIQSLSPLTITIQSLSLFAQLGETARGNPLACVYESCFNRAAAVIPAALVCSHPSRGVLNGGCSWARRAMAHELASAALARYLTSNAVPCHANSTTLVLQTGWPEITKRAKVHHLARIYGAESQFDRYNQKQLASAKKVLGEWVRQGETGLLRSLVKTWHENAWLAR